MSDLPDGRIVLYGATGYTGRLVAAALLRRGVLPVLAGRSRERLNALADELAGSHPGGRPETAVADATKVWEVAALLRRDDVLVTTVGPFLRVGWPAAEAVTTAGGTYLDSTGEPPFLARVFTELGPRARESGARLLPAFGYDYVPGNLAAALALRDAGDAATRVDVGYFVRGRLGPSGGTVASAAGMLAEPGRSFRAGALVRERPAARVRTFRVAGASLGAATDAGAPPDAAAEAAGGPARTDEAQESGISVGGSEHYALPRLCAGLRDVDVYLGWTGPLSRLVQAGSAVGAELARLPGVGDGLRTLGGVAARRLLPGSSGGPDERARARARTVAVAEAFSPDGTVLSRVQVEGPSPYDLTAELLAWGAATARDGGLRGAGALGPVDGFGLELLEAGCAEIGLVRRPDVSA